MSLDMSVLIFRFPAYAIVALALALAGAVLLPVLKHRFRQRSLQKIPGPSSPSFIWGKCHRLEKNRSHAQRDMKVIRATFSTTMPFSSTKGYTERTEKWHASMVFSGCVELPNAPNCYDAHHEIANRTYNLWYLTRRHVITLLSRINSFSSKQRRCVSTYFLYESEPMLVSNPRSWNLHAFGPGLFATTGGHVVSKYLT
jgi:hypothetical protein